VDRYIDLFKIKSITGNKHYKISIDKTKTQEASGEIVLSCNCPNFVHRASKKGEQCKHITEVWSKIYYILDDTNPFRSPVSFAKDYGWESFDEWFNDSPEAHIGIIRKTYTIRSITGMEKTMVWKISEPFVSPFNPTILTRMCVSCEFPQEIPLDFNIFSCKNCGRKQRI
jgi:hypothetical protein